ncbi:putative Transforming protein RhoA [Blattamonas nauphoetae]|uniref:Transforming protein RhoA n=1 Tax=Blattamonas nauphoetae TaxID=2049346 RepID=A0ABQ9Y2W5_9EUKA|nr:putative Transforming protein RhoA [Blattamonas nauphoetae]
MSTEIKIVVVGDGAIGKTSLLYVYANDSFPEDYIPTVVDDYTANTSYNGKNINLSLWDTAGQEEYDALRPLSYENTNVYLLCYSLDNKGSLENIKQKWNAEVENHGKGVPKILVGTKMDLQDSVTDPDKRITDEYLEKVRQEVGAKASQKCSAKKKEGVKEVFLEAIKCYFEGQSQGGGGGCSCELF